MKTFRILMTAALLAALSTAAYAIHETQPAETQVTLPGANAAALYDYITKGSPYTQWALWPGKGKMYKGSLPHGSYLTTYVNETALAGIKAKKGSLTDGAIIVKVNYGPDRNFVALTVLHKIKGYNPAAGNWYWAKYDARGKTLEAGRVDACINCHAQGKDNDYIFSGALK